MANTFVDQIVEYPATAIRLIGRDSNIVALLTDTPSIDMDSDEAYSVYDKYLFDYGYVDGTTESTEAYICVEAEINRVSSPTMQDLRVFATIICHKGYMQLDPSTFTGVLGNRRDNLVRYVDKVLNGSEVFGIGKLSLDSIRTVSAPNGFSAREITYKVVDFKDKGVVRIQ